MDKRKIVELHPPRAPLIRKPRTYPRCTHEHIWIDTDRRRLSCRACDCDVDPIGFIDRLSRAGTSYEHQMKERRKLIRSIQDLKRREKNAKALVKKWEARASKCGGGK